MSDPLRRALADLDLIKGHLAAGSAFRGYAPAAIAATGALAGLVWAIQSVPPADPPADAIGFLLPWFAIAAASVVIVGTAMVARGRRHHDALADAMAWEAAERFLPCGAAGALLALVVLARAPDLAWLLPPAWSILVGLGIFSAARQIPGKAWIAGGWYVLAGAGTLTALADARALEPWAMGLPFLVGQVLLAILISLAPGGEHAA